MFPEETTEDTDEMSSAEGAASREKVAKLLAASFNAFFSEECIEPILRMAGDVNHPVPLNQPFDGKLQTGTVLHRLSKLRVHRIPKVINLLLQHGLDITRKNSQGQTALHAELAQTKRTSDWDVAKSLRHPLIEAVLSAHVDHSIRQNPCDDHGVSHFHVACMTGHARAVGFFLGAGVDVDQPISSESPVFAGCTPLHLAVFGGHMETTRTLLQHGADAWSKNAQGLSAAFAIVKRNLSIINRQVDAWRVEAIEEYELRQRMLRLLLTSGEISGSSNTSGKYDATTTRLANDELGFTKFHVACACDDASLAKALLRHGDDVNRRISADSPLWPGYTPLHFAAHFSVDVVKLLLAEGGNLLSEDAKGVTPLDVFLQRQRVVDLRDLLAAHPSLRNIRMSDGKTKLLDLLDAMRSWQTFRWYLENHANDLFVEESSPLCPGFSAFHFAVLFSERASSEFHELRARRGNEEVDSGEQGRVRITWPYEECYRRGVKNFVRRGAAGRASPLRLALSLQRSLLVQTTLKNIYGKKGSDYLFDEDGWSFLHCACGWSPIEPAEPAVIDRAIADGADVNLPLGSSIQLNCQTFQPDDDTPLRFFVVAGTTPLHMAVGAGHARIVEQLMQHGADVNATNAEGWSPLHMVMLSGRVDIGTVMLSLATNLEENVMEGTGLSNLHVACYCDCSRSVKKLIELGSDVNAVLRFEPLRFYRPTVDITDDRCSASNLLRQTGYAGFTPLHFAVKNGSREVAGALLAAGADALARNAEGTSPLHAVLTTSERNEQLVDLFVGHLRNDEGVQRRLKEDSGVTLLHVLTFAMNLEVVAGVDVNARAKEDSPIWPGCTALHAWVHGTKGRDLADERVRSTLRVLLDAGADVTLSNEALDTPLHLFDRSFAEVEGEIILSTGRLLLDSQRDFAVNPTNASGISHFHIAVRMRALAVVEAFLERGVDVNQRTDVFSSKRPGYSALHLLAYESSRYLQALPDTRRTLDLLLSRGADARARDVFGNTPLHAIAEAVVWREDFTRKIVGAGGSLHVANHVGETPFAAMLNRSIVSAREVDFFLRQGCRLNDYTAVRRRGFLALPLCAIFPPFKHQMEVFYKMLLENPDMTSVDEAGRTAIHNVASSPAETAVLNRVYVESIARLVRLGCDIDARDHTGKTALHTAARFKNVAAVVALLLNGADVNLVDDSNKCAFDYALDVCNQCLMEQNTHRHLGLIETIVTEILKLQHAKLDVSERNKDLAKRITLNERARSVLAKLRTEVEAAKKIQVKSWSSLKLYDLLSETGAIAAYPTMSRANRRIVEEAFGFMLMFDAAGSLFALQFKKLLKRTALVDRAVKSLWVLSGIALPQLCCQCLLRYLSYSDVEHLVASSENS